MIWKRMYNVENFYVKKYLIPESDLRRLEE